MSRARTLANFGGTDLATQAELDAKAEYNDDVIQTNLALLAFKTAVNGSLAKYDLQDQIVDEYTTNAGVNTGDSTNEELTGGVYRGEGAYTVTGGMSGENPATVGSYKVHTFLIGQTGTNFVVPSGLVMNVDWLVVAGGGAGGDSNTNSAGGGGAGGFRTGTSHAVTAQSYTITVGAGGVAGTNIVGPSGGNSIFDTITSAGGGGGAAQSVSEDGIAGGSGGGASYAYGDGGGVTAIIRITNEVTTVQGFVGGGVTTTSGGNAAGTGGGGASEAGETVNQDGQANAGTGGDGVANSYRTGSPVTYAGGGGGEAYDHADVAGGAGGGGATNVAGTANTGGGGGGGSNGSTDRTGRDGGSGIVVIRYLTSALTGPGNLTLQSTDTEAEAQPTKADMVMLVEDAGSGVATLGTHIKGFISRDSGTTFTEGTLVDEGDWGTDKRILAFHDLDISSQPADQTMCYKITTHSASAVYDTRIHATSIGWR